jgi:hypothetical protein
VQLATTHVDAAQPGVAFATSAQGLLQPPQLLTLVAVATSQPLA